MRNNKDTKMFRKRTLTTKSPSSTDPLKYSGNYAIANVIRLSPIYRGEKKVLFDILCDKPQLGHPQ